MTELFRRCPGCGHRFRVKIIDEKLVNSYQTRIEGPLVAGKRPARGGQVSLKPVRMPDLLLDVKEYRTDYKCEHCGHQWSEIRREEKRGH